MAHACLFQTEDFKVILQLKASLIYMRPSLKKPKTVGSLSLEPEEEAGTQYPELPSWGKVFQVGAGARQGEGPQCSWPCGVEWNFHLVLHREWGLDLSSKTTGSQCASHVSVDFLE